MKIDFNIQGHRGCRGLFPENTLVGFIEALKLGVNALELDVVISKDHQLVVSHEAWMNEKFCSLPDGSAVPMERARSYNLYKMNYEEIKLFDCGKRSNPDFPGQNAIPSYKPLLKEVINTVESFCEEQKKEPVIYDIELKSEEDEVYNPAPDKYIDIILNEIRSYKAGPTLRWRSFDVRLLKEFRKRDKSLAIGLLVENEKGLEYNLDQLGFIPEIYSPEHILTDQDLVQQVHERGMKFIPWTVNELSGMEQLINMGVDGIITDYPDRLINVLRSVSK